MRKIARTCAGLHRNLSQRLPSGGDYVLDEEETYEGSSIRTLTVPILIERKSWFLVAADTAPIRRLARRGTTRRAWQDAHEQQHGRRPDRSRECVEGVLRELDRRCTGQLGLHTDKKASYARSCKKVFGDRATHTTTSGTEARTIRNPLFPINATIAMSRDNCGRLRRKSWLVSKAARWLKAQLDLFAVTATTCASDSTATIRCWRPRSCSGCCRAGCGRSRCCAGSRTGSAQHPSDEPERDAIGLNADQCAPLGATRARAPTAK
ncbi:MAG: hypothetical protein ACE37K_00005 [Planctomycetota bacterium]